MKHLRKPSPLTMACSVVGLMGISGAAMAGEVCDPNKEKCPPPPCTKNCTTLCHNIGGPDELGANCDGATGACSFTLDTGATIVVAANHFLGIIISAGPMSLAAHLKHGDGFVETEFDPPLHLASTGQIHKASNVECLAERATTTQPPEPGN
jgi:hypothetical protein